MFIPKNPEKSIWYDKVFNPYGVAPPGETYQEKDQVQTTTVKRKLDEISDISDHLSDSDDSELSFNINEPRYMDLGDIEIPAGKPARDLVDFYNSLDVPEVYHLEKSNKKSTSTLVQNLEQQKQQHQHQNLPVFPIPPPGFPIPPVGFPIPPVGFMHPPNFPPLGFPPLPMPIQRAPPAITSLPVPSGPQLGYSSVAIPEPKIDRPFRDPFAHPSASVISADPTVSNVKKDKGISKMVPMVLMKKAAKKDQELEDFLNSV